jgi:hypothetical protein
LWPCPELCSAGGLAVLGLAEEAEPGPGTVIGTTTLVVAGVWALGTMANDVVASLADNASEARRARTVANGGRASAGTKREVEVEAANREAHNGVLTCVTCGKNIEKGENWKDKKNYGHKRRGRTAVGVSPTTLKCSAGL